jgi:hypothetical protein
MATAAAQADVKGRCQAQDDVCGLGRLIDVAQFTGCKVGGKLFALEPIRLNRGGEKLGF